MLHLLYILAFTALALLAVANLIRSMVTLGADATRPMRETPSPSTATQRGQGGMPHPEMMDESGNVVREPLLVMKSMTVEDARDHLNSIYESSPGGQPDRSDDPTA